MLARESSPRTTRRGTLASTNVYTFFFLNLLKIIMDSVPNTPFVIQNPFDNNDNVMYFLKLYLSHPELHDTSDLNYYNTGERNKILQNIADEMNTHCGLANFFTIKKLKDKFKNCRSQYRDTKNSLNASKTTGSSAKNVKTPKLFYFQLLDSHLSQIPIRKGIDTEDDNIFARSSTPVASTSPATADSYFSLVCDDSPSTFVANTASTSSDHLSSTSLASAELASSSAELTTLIYPASIPSSSSQYSPSGASSSRQTFQDIPIGFDFDQGFDDDNFTEQSTSNKFSKKISKRKKPDLNQDENLKFKKKLTQVLELELEEK